VLARIVDSNTLMPGQQVNFFGFTGGAIGPIGPSVSGNHVAFFGYGQNWQGIYLNVDGNLVRIADRNTLAPGSNSGLSNFVPDSGLNVEPAIDGLNVAFRAARAGGVQGLYVSFDGALTKVVETSDRVPGGTGVFSSFRSMALAANNVVFWAFDAANRPGLYQWNGRFLKRLIGGGDIINGKTVNSLLFSRGGLDKARATSLI
jgi:hypothetical protein